jgi:hypothetical protein
MKSLFLMVWGVMSSGTFWTAIATVAIAIYTYYAREQWKAMSDQMAVMRQQLEMTNRAWVQVELAIAGPLTFDASGARVRFAVRVSNVGHSPAFNVNIIPRIVNAQGIDAVTEQQKACSSYDHIPLGAPWGGTLFPGKDAEQRFELVADKAELDKSQSFVGLGHDTTSAFLPHIVGCVDYVIAYPGRHHQTFFSYQLMVASSSGKADFIRRNIDVPPERIRLYKDTQVGDRAN